MEIRRDVARYSDQDQPMNRWSLIIDGETVSELWVSIETGEIMQVETPPGTSTTATPAPCTAPPPPRSPSTTPR
jgi:hypothetical protein